MGRAASRGCRSDRHTQTDPLCEEVSMPVPPSVLEGFDYIGLELEPQYREAMHVPLNDHQGATGPDTSPFEPTASDDEFLELPRTTPQCKAGSRGLVCPLTATRPPARTTSTGSPTRLLGRLWFMHIDAEWATTSRAPADSPVTTVAT